MMRRRAWTCGGRPRSGTAIVAALGLLMLGAALLASAALVAFSSTRATRAAAAMLQAESMARRAVSGVAASWSPIYDTLAVGHSISTRVGMGHAPGAAGASAAAILRVQRLTLTLYAVSVDAQSGVMPLRARRRFRVFVQRVDTGSMPARVRLVTPLARWTSADLY